MFLQSLSSSEILNTYNLGTSLLLHFADTYLRDRSDVLLNKPVLTKLGIMQRIFTKARPA